MTNEAEEQFLLKGKDAQAVGEANRRNAACTEVTDRHFFS